MEIAVFAALGAALCWAFGSLIAHYPSQYLGAIGFNKVRSIMVVVMLGVAATLFGGWETVTDMDMILLLLLGGIVGIFLGDTALFATLRRMGPRRTAILFALNAPIVTLLSVLFLGETLSPSVLIGCGLVLSGVFLAIIYGKRKSQLHQWEEVKGPLALGVLFGLLAAVFQAIGIVITKPALTAGVDPIAASCLRVGIAGLALIVMGAWPGPRFKSKAPMTGKIALAVFFSALLGMGIGMTLLLYGLAHGDAGVVATMAATSPVMMLPLIWIKTKEFPAIGAWVGAFLVAVGTGFIFNG